MAIGTTLPDGSPRPWPHTGWETIDSSLERIAVPGGWLYRSRVHTDQAPIVFVPVEEAR
jgi:hypothetical protein